MILCTVYQRKEGLASNKLTCRNNYLKQVKYFIEIAYYQKDKILDHKI